MQDARHAGTTPTSPPTWRRAGRPWCARWSCSAARWREAGTWSQTGLARCYAALGPGPRGRRHRRRTSTAPCSTAWHEQPAPSRASCRSPAAPATDDRRGAAAPGARGRAATADARAPEALVLRFVADLTEVQVADVLDVPVGTGRPGPRRSDASTLPRCAGDSEVRATRRRTSRTSHRRAIAVAPAPRAVVVGPRSPPASLVAGRRGPGAPTAAGRRSTAAGRAGAPSSHRVAQPGRGGLVRRRTAAPRRTSTVRAAAAHATWSRLGAGVGVRRRRRRAVVYVGRRRRAHRARAQGPVGRRSSASDERGWVAWVDPAGDNPELVVYDVAQATIVGERIAGADRRTGPVAIDQDQRSTSCADGRTRSGSR